MNKDYLSTIKTTVTEMLDSIPDGVTLVAAAKTRLPDEVKAAITGGIKVIGYNYIQEAERLRPAINEPVQWHMIGHLQRNKVKKAVKLFDMIETIDSVELAKELNKQCIAEDKIMPVLIETNSGKESNKTGVLPENAENLIKHISSLSNLRVQGIMTMEFEILKGVSKNEDQNIGKFLTPVVKKVIVGNIGPSSYNEVISYGCKVYLCRNMSVSDAVRKVKDDEVPLLKEPTLKDSIHSARKTDEGDVDSGHGEGRGTGKGLGSGPRDGSGRGMGGGMGRGKGGRWR